MNLELLTGILVLIPGAVFLILALTWLIGWEVRESALAWITCSTYSILTLGFLWLSWQLARADFPTLVVSLGHWFKVGHYAYPLSFMLDRLSLAMAILTVFLVGIVGSFSVRYLHRDPGYFRFFLLLHLYGFGSLLLFTASSLDLLVAGWELVGLTSVLLIGFFQQRREPVSNALRVFGTYRIADLFLLAAVFVMHHELGSGLWQTSFPGDWPQQGYAHAGQTGTVLCLLLIFAACGKASQGPFSGWLPRAMEGPTPSSAVFYGAISVHAGAYLLLRIHPLITASWVTSSFLLFVGLTTAGLATLIHRTCADAKTSLAYASMTQLGIIFSEVALGWHTLALVHTIGHAALRTTQFLRAPSMLHEHHRLHSAAGGHLGSTGAHYHFLVPKTLQTWLYAVGMERGCYDALLERFVLNPIHRFSVLLGRIEPANWSSDQQTQLDAHKPTSQVKSSKD